MTSAKAHAKAQKCKGSCERPPKKIFAPLRLCVIFSLLVFSAAVKAQTNGSSDAEIKGRKLAWQLCDAKPEGNLTNNGVLKIKASNGKTIETRTKFEVILSETNWVSSYEIHNDWGTESLSVTHVKSENNFYYFHKDLGDSACQKTLSGNKAMIPFAGSDFWLCDLGLEFFHWPRQKLLPKTTTLKRGRDYTLLESTCPNPPANGYSRVLSWIDKDTGGVLYAEAYDVQGKLLKEFEPKSFKKVNGQWELSEMEIRNVQTGSRTRLEFDLDAK
jgi:hypothetical protein